MEEGAEDRRVGTDCRGSGSRPRALSYSRHAGTGRSVFLSFSFPLIFIFSLSPVPSFSAVRVHPRKYAGCLRLRAYIADFMSARCYFAGRFTKIWIRQHRSARAIFCWVHALERVKFRRTNKTNRYLSPPNTDYLRISRMFHEYFRSWIKFYKSFIFQFKKQIRLRILSDKNWYRKYLIKLCQYMFYENKNKIFIKMFHRIQ